MLNVKEATKSCVQSRKLLRSQSATMRALIKSRRSRPETEITPMAETLRKHLRESMLLHIDISQQISQSAAILIDRDPGGTVKLWEAWRRLEAMHQKVGELLKTVVKELSRGQTATRRRPSPRR